MSSGVCSTCGIDFDELVEPCGTCGFGNADTEEMEEGKELDFHLDADRRYEEQQEVNDNDSTE